jgi:hypothetical protein
MCGSVLQELSDQRGHYGWARLVFVKERLGVMPRVGSPLFHRLRELHEKISKEETRKSPRQEESAGSSDEPGKSSSARPEAEDLCPCYPYSQHGASRACSALAAGCF